MWGYIAWCHRFLKQTFFSEEHTIAHSYSHSRSQQSHCRFDSNCHCRSYNNCHRHFCSHWFSFNYFMAIVVVMVTVIVYKLWQGSEITFAAESLSLRYIESHLRRHNHTNSGSFPSCIHHSGRYAHRTSWIACRICRTLRSRNLKKKMQNTGQTWSMIWSCSKISSSKQTSVGKTSSIQKFITTLY